VRIRAWGIAIAIAAIGTVALVPAEASAKPIRAKIVRTKYGIPHIKAKNIRSLSAGYAYALAQDNICSIASEYVTTSAKRSRFFGPDEDWTFSGSGITYKNIDADVYFQWVKDQGAVEKLAALKPPLGPKRGVKQGVAGYVKGYNAYLRDVGVDNIPDPRCRGAEWVRPIRKIDEYRRFYQLGILASSGAAIGGIATAEPATGGALAAQQAQQDEMLADGSALSRLQLHIGSNAYAFGKEATKNGKGLVYGNPHFPWDGSERFYQAHLTIPGKVDVAGGSLYGVPLILIGHTRGLAWSHTVATAWRFTPFKLTLGPDPHTYVVDGETKDMEKTDVTVKASDGNGGFTDVNRSIYSTEYGPMVTDLVGIPLPWGGGNGFALGDVNATNFRYLNHFLANNRAQTVEQYDRIQRKYQGIPWVNSIAADSKGHAYYTMQGAVPNVSDEHSTECNVALAGFETLGLPILDGSRSDCAWETSPDAVAPGTFPPDDLPTLFRDDYIENSNDSHWLSNPEEPLTGFNRIVGIENADRFFRTRMGLVQVEDRLAGTDGLPGKKFDRKSVEKVAMRDRVYLGEQWRDGVVQLCDLAPGGFLAGSSGPVDVSGACDPLRDWDLTDRLDSNGSVLFRRFAVNLLSNFQCLPTGLEGSTCPGQETLFTTPYSNADPVHTPAGLNVANPLVGIALADAVTDLDGAGIPLDSPLRGVQSDVRGGEAIPIGGGPHGLGVFNVISAAWDPDNGGYTNIPHGGSFIMSAQFEKGKGCPVSADTFLTYGESENQSSPHASDYTKAFSKGQWLHEPFCAADVKRAAIESYRVRIGKRR
jgi:acyl-homoserine-lactone acylase